MVEEQNCSLQKRRPPKLYHTTIQFYFPTPATPYKLNTLNQRWVLLLLCIIYCYWYGVIHVVSSICVYHSMCVSRLTGTRLLLLLHCCCCCLYLAVRDLMRRWEGSIGFHKARSLYSVGEDTDDLLGEETIQFWVLCSLMIPGFTNDIGVFLYICLQIIGSDIRPHTWWHVSLVTADGHLIFLTVCVSVYGLTYSLLSLLGTGRGRLVLSKRRFHIAQTSPCFRLTSF